MLASQGVEEVSTPAPAPAEEPSRQVSDEKTWNADETSQESIAPAVGEGTSAPAERKGGRWGQRTGAQIAIIMAALCMALFLAALDMTIITTAVPTIVGHFDSGEGYTWIGSAYLLACAATGPLWGKFSDIWGRKPILLAVNTVFFAGSLLCGAAVSMGMLLAGRVVQGCGGGGLIILVNVCISDLVSLRDRATFYGITSMVWALSSAIGPIIGGALTQRASWRWCFYLNLPCSGASFAVLFFYLKLYTPKTPLWAGLKAIDWLGSVTIVGGTVMFLLGLQLGGVTDPWASAKVLGLIIGGLATLGLFVLNEWKLATYPIVPLRLFARRSNVAALLAALCHALVFFSGDYYLPLYFQAVRGASPLLSGASLLPFAVTLSAASGLGGLVVRATGRYRPPIWFGMAVMIAGFALFTNLTASSPWVKLILYQLVAGVGVGPNFQCPLIALQSHVPAPDVATATATFGFTRNLAAAASVVVGAAVLQNGLRAREPALRAAGLPPALVAQLTSGSAGASVQVIDALGAGPQRDAARGAFAGSLQAMWVVYAALGGAGLVVSLFIQGKTLSREHVETRTGLESQRERRREVLEEKARARAGVGRGDGKEVDVETGRVPPESRGTLASEEKEKEEKEVLRKI